MTTTLRMPIRAMLLLTTVVLYTANAGFGAEATVTLSDGSKIRMTEPVDTVGPNWENLKNRVPRVFFTVGENTANPTSTKEKISQLLATARSIGLLYLNRSEKATGGQQVDIDMLEREKEDTAVRAGKRGPKAKEAVEKGDAVVLWWSMLEGKAKELGIKKLTDPPYSPNAGTIFMDEYIDMVEKGNDPDIYSEVIVKVVKTNPSAFFSYLQKASPERRKIVEEIVAESDQE